MKIADMHCLLPSVSQSISISVPQSTCFVHKAYSGCEKPTCPKKISSLDGQGARCPILIVLMLAPPFTSPNCCRPAIMQFQSPISLLRQLHPSFTRSSLCLLAQSKIQVLLQLTRWSCLHAHSAMADFSNSLRPQASLCSLSLDSSRRIFCNCLDENQSDTGHVYVWWSG